MKLSLRNENSFVCGLIVSAGEFRSRFFLAHQTLWWFLLWRIEKAVELEIEILMPFFVVVCLFSLSNKNSGFTKKRSRLTFLKIESNPRLIIVKLSSWIFWFLIHCCFWVFFHWSISFSFYTLYNRRLSNACTTVLPLVLLVLVTLDLGSSPTMMMGNERQRDWFYRLLAHIIVSFN